MAVQRTKDVERLTVELPADLARRVDDYRFENRIPTRVGAIRDLIEAGLAAKAQDARTERDDRAADERGKP